MQEPSLENSISMAKCFDQTVKQFTAWITKFAFMLIDLIVKVVLVRYLARILQPGRHADQLGCKIFAKKSGPTSSEQGFLAEHDHKDRSRAEARATGRGGYCLVEVPSGSGTSPLRGRTVACCIILRLSKRLGFRLPVIAEPSVVHIEEVDAVVTVFFSGELV